MDFLNHREGGMVFYHCFLLSPLQCTAETVRGCVNLKKYKTQGKAVEVTVIARRRTLKTFVWISSKNSASAQILLIQNVFYRNQNTAQCSTSRGLIISGRHDLKKIMRSCSDQKKWDHTETCLQTVDLSVCLYFCLSPCYCWRPWCCWRSCCCFHPCCCLRSCWCYCPSWSWHPYFSWYLCKLHFTLNILNYRTIRPRLSECYFFLLSEYRISDWRSLKVIRLSDLEFWYIGLSDIRLSKNNRLPHSEKQSIESLISNIWRACKVKSRSASFLNQTSLHSCPADSAK